jgi:hypothetical protein
LGVPVNHLLTSYGTAKRLRGKGESAPGTIVMSIIECEQCGARFTIAHRSGLQDPARAERQAIWLRDRFVWDHIQENKHCGSTALPELPVARPPFPIAAELPAL